MGSTFSAIPRFGDGRDWFFEKRFGMFVHWGLYAIPAWHEQDQWRRSVPRAEYARLIEQFNPVRFDPEAWLDTLQAAGMEYLCVTTKHHDGFCLWDTQQTDFNVMRSPYGRDVVGLLADACHRRDVPLCLYYSIVDWHHPNYPNQGRHHELAAPEHGDSSDWESYMAFLKNQVRELCTNYGEIHGIWWDMNVPKHQQPSAGETAAQGGSGQAVGSQDTVSAMIRQLQPKAVMNNRGFDHGDFSTPERHVPEGRRFERPTEACQSLGRESWGYRADEDYYAAKHLMQSIDKIMAMGGNYLLNVGPRADGTIPEEQVALLRKIGAWFSAVNESFYGAAPASHLTENQDVLLTRRGDTLYVHLYKDPESSGITLHPLEAAPSIATLLTTGREGSSLPEGHLKEPPDRQPEARLDARVDMTPRRWVEQWNQGRRGTDIRPGLRLLGLPVDGLASTVPILKLEFAPGALPE